MGILSRPFPHLKVATIGSRLLRCTLAGLLFLAQGAPAQTSAQANSIERQVKAAYLYKFASYVEWPPGALPDPASPLIIGVLGADLLADELEQIVAGHTVNGRPIITRRLKRGDKPSGLHILFIGHADKGHLLELFAEAKDRALLTVTESAEAHALGSMINFVITGERVRFQVALEPVGLAHLKISARMLTAAYKVAGGSS